MKSIVRAVEYHLPEKVVGNEELAELFPEWPAEKISKKLGVSERRVAAADECASDLGVRAAQKLFERGVCAPGEVDYLLFCTQAPDYFLPTTACLIADRLGLPKTVGALDFNLGCSGYVYGLSLAKGLVETGQARRLLFITADTYSKYLHPMDKGVRTLFGDGAAATLIEAIPDEMPEAIGPFVFGTDGSGAGQLILEAGAARKPVADGQVRMDARGAPRGDAFIYMNGRDIYNFSSSAVPPLVEDVLTKAGLTRSDVDLFVFHQANAFMLEHLRKRCDIPPEKFPITMDKSGNTVSSSIPIALRDAEVEGRLRSGQIVLLVGFGVGLSWAGTLIRWP